MNTKSRFIQVMTLVAGAICGFLAGLAVFQQRPSAAIIESPGATTDESRSRAEPRGFSNSDSEDIAAVLSAWQERDSLRRGRETKRALDRLNADQLATLVAQVEAQVNYETEPLLISLFQRWVRVAPEAAAAWVRRAYDRQLAGGGNDADSALVFNAWCKSDPERAIALALERPESGMSFPMVIQAMGAIGNGDPASQLQRALTMPEGKLRTGAVRTAIGEWAKSDPAVALARLESLNLSTEAQGPALASIFTEWAGKDAGAALSEISRRMGSSENGSDAGLYRQAIEMAAAADPDTALALAEKLGSEFAVAVLRGMAARDPVGALRWGEAHGLDLNPVIAFAQPGWSDGTILGRALASDPARTVAWLRTLPSGSDRAQFLHPIAPFDECGSRARGLLRASA